MVAQSLENLHTFSYNIIETSPASLAHNSVFICPNNIVNLVQMHTCMLCGLVGRIKIWDKLTIIGANCIIMFLICHVQNTGTSNTIDSTKIL